MSKKKTPKKAPAKKLIDGKYSHKFITRFSPDEGDHLEKVMKHEGIKTFNGAVLKSVSSYLSMKEKISELEQKVDELENSNTDIIETVGDFQSVMKKLSTFKTALGNNTKLVECADCYDEFYKSELVKHDGELICKDCASLR